jgi:predicted dehydrogenase/threonine dehydrogenase-like Zn-dependent dehydrogenase
MIQLLQSLQDGRTLLADVPVPRATGRQVLIETRATVVSPGTERMLVEFGKAGWLEKARRQPDKLRQVLEKVRTDGLAPTLDAVRARLGTPIPLGYCHAGVVTEIGPEVSAVAVGDRVVSNGPHAEYVRVAETLVARIPDDVGFEAAAFTPLAAIGLQGLRLAAPTLGETVVVYGLGLIGLLTVQLARAAGCRVIGLDRDGSRVERARQFGAEAVMATDGDAAAAAVLERTGGVGADAVLLTLATESSEPVQAAAAMSRKRGRIVLVGVAGLALRRDDFYAKELTFQVSCSYGPGRYDRAHEERGVDYPLPFVRWTEGRNFAAVLQLMADGRLDPLPLVTHRVLIRDATRAYDIVAGVEPSLGIVLEYPEQSGAPPAERRRVALRGGAPSTARCRIGCIGAGAYATRILLPALRQAGAELELIASSGGVTAALTGRAHGFREASTDVDAVFRSNAVDTIVVATRHDSHAAFAERALRSGKHVFVEKPLALSLDELEQVAQAVEVSQTVLAVGFNRRLAPLVREALELCGGRSGPLAVVITVNAGRVAADHWTRDRGAGGGRIVGEACHFIDLARCFVGSPIQSLQVTPAAPDGRAADDVALLQLGFKDGSVAAVHYLANGSPAFPKERVELFFDGKVARIENFRRLVAWGIPRAGSRLPRRQDKGHTALAAAFVQAVRGQGPPPIPAEELLEVSRWAIVAGAAARRQLGHAETP